VAKWWKEERSCFEGCVVIKRLRTVTDATPQPSEQDTAKPAGRKIGVKQFGRHTQHLNKRANACEVKTFIRVTARWHCHNTCFDSSVSSF
jgi:hypothetical protein